jgi:hypothetical protein
VLKTKQNKTKNREEASPESSQSEWNRWKEEVKGKQTEVID